MEGHAQLLSNFRCMSLHIGIKSFLKKHAQYYESAHISTKKGTAFKKVGVGIQDLKVFVHKSNNDYTNHSSIPEEAFVTINFVLV